MCPRCKARGHKNKLKYDMMDGYEMHRCYTCGYWSTGYVRSRPTPANDALMLSNLRATIGRISTSTVRSGRR